MSKLSVLTGIVVDYSADGWPEFRKWLDGSYAALRYTWVDEGMAYQVAAPDGLITRVCSFNKGADAEDFEANWKTNAAITQTTPDGRLDVRITAANKGRIFKLRVISFYTATAAPGPRSRNPINCQDYGDVSVTLQKWDAEQGAMVASEPADATKTIIDWDPLYEYEIIGGWLDIPPDLLGGGTDQWYLGCIALPDYAAYGMAIDYVSELNLEAVSSNRIRSDGRATSGLAPTVVNGINYHTNRLRWIVLHPAGVAKRMQIYLETFQG